MCANPTHIFIIERNEFDAITQQVSKRKRESGNNNSCLIRFSVVFWRNIFSTIFIVFYFSCLSMCAVKRNKTFPFISFFL